MASSRLVLNRNEIYPKARELLVGIVAVTVFSKLLSRTDTVLSAIDEVTNRNTIDAVAASLPPPQKVVAQRRFARADVNCRFPKARQQ